MAYGLPARGQQDWDDEMNNSIEALKATADAALAASSTAVATAGYARDRADAVHTAVLGAPDATVAELVEDTASLTAGALSTTFVGKGDLTLRATDNGVSTSNTAAQNKTALDALGVTANALGASIYIPAGEYNLTSWQLPVPAQRVGLKVYGDGVGRTVLKGASAAPLVIMGDGEPTYDAQHISLDDMTLDGNGLSTHCIKHNHTRFCRVSNLEIKGAATYGVWFVGDLANYFALYEHCRFYNNPVHVYLDGGSAGIGGNSNWFRACHFSAATGTYNGVAGGVHVAINGGDTNVFELCEFITNGTTGIYLHNSATNNKIVFNQFDGPAVQVNVASVGVTSTIISGNTGGGTFTDAGTATFFMGPSTADSISQLLYSMAGMVVGGPRMPVGTVPLRVKAPASATTDVFRAEKSDASTLFRVDKDGNIETGSIGAVTAHAHSVFNNANNSSVSLTIDTGPSTSASQGNIGLRVRKRNSGHVANVAEFQDDAGVRMSAIGPKGELKLPSIATASLPSAATAGAGAVIYDSTLNKRVCSDGSTWKETANVLNATATLDFPSVAAAGSQELTITVTGAAVGDTVALGAPAAIEAGLIWNGYVSATNTVKVRLSNITTGAIDPASATWKATIVR